MKFRRVLGFLSVGIITVALIFGALHHEDIIFAYKLRGYTPDKEIVALADNTTMLDSSRKLFYVNRPVIADNELFNDKCRENQHSIVLGCYLSGQSGIYLLNIKDERLKGIKEVTAAHEFLHAAYERLSDKEKQKVNKLLEDAFKDVENTRVREAIELYRKEDPKIVPNELHSIIGSEIRTLPPELEEYYSRYFSNRLKIVAYSEQYEQAFVERRNSIRDYDERLESQKSDIDATSDRLNKEKQEINDLEARLTQMRNDDSTIDEYNELVAQYKQRVADYNQEVDELTAKVVRYNEIVRLRNNIATEEAQLVDALDSRKVVPDQQ